MSKTTLKVPRALFSDAIWKVLPDICVTARLFGALLKSTAPLGLTVKLTVPALCFENVKGLGLVVTVTTHGVGVGIGFGSGDSVGEGVASLPELDRVWCRRGLRIRRWCRIRIGDFRCR